MPLLSRWGGSHCSIGQCQEEKKRNAVWGSPDPGLGRGNLSLRTITEQQGNSGVRCWDEIWDGLLPSGDTAPRTSPFLSQEMPVETLRIRLKGCPLPTLTYLSKADGAKRGQRKWVNVGHGPVGDSSRHQAEPPRSFPWGWRSFFPHARPDSEEAASACAPCPPSLQQPRLGAAARPSSTSGLVSRAHGSRRFSIRRSRPPSHVLSVHRLSASSGIGRNPRQGRGVLSTPAQCTPAPYPSSRRQLGWRLGKLRCARLSPPGTDSVQSRCGARTGLPGWRLASWGAGDLLMTEVSRGTVPSGVTHLARRAPEPGGGEQSLCTCWEVGGLPKDSAWFSGGRP